MEQTTASTGLDYAGGNISGLFRQIFFPTLAAMVTGALLVIADGIFVGQGVGPDGIAAVNIIAPLYMVVTGVGLMFGMGSSVMASVAISQGDNRRGCILFTQAVALATALITVLIILLSLFPTATARLLGCSDRLMPHALDYLLWLIPGLFFCSFQSIGVMLIRLDGSPKYAMVCNITASLVNLVLDWWMVFPLGMGTKGAALATSISVAVGALMMLVYFLRYSYIIRFIWSSRRFFSNIFRQACIGASSLISELAMSVMMLTGNFVFMRYFAEAGVAAFSIACYLFPVMFMMSQGVAQSAQPILSYNYGAGLSDRVRAALGVSVRWATCCGLIATLIIAIPSRQLVGMFIDPTCEAGVLASAGLPIFSACAIFFAVNIAFIGYYQSIELAGRALLMTLLRGVIFLVPAFLLLPLIISPKVAVWSAIPLAELLTLIVILITNRSVKTAKA